MIRYLALLLLFFTADSSIKHRLLADGLTKVPADENYFTKNYREKYTVGLPEGVEPNVLYVPLYIPSPNTYFETVPPKWPEFGSYAIMFYDNGCVNEFVSYRSQPDITLDPNHQGYRGICFNKGNRKFVAFYLPAETKEPSITERRSKLITSKNGDTLVFKDSGYKTIFKKDKSGIKTNYTANW